MVNPNTLHKASQFGDQTLINLEEFEFESRLNSSTNPRAEQCLAISVVIIGKFPGLC